MPQLATRCTFCALLFLAASAGHAASPQFQQAVINSAPVLYYQLNEESGDAINYGSLGATFNATYEGTPMRGVAGYFGDTAVKLDGTDDYLESLAVAPESLTGNPTFSIEAVIFVPFSASIIAYPPLLHWGPADATPDGHSVFFGFRGNQPDQVFSGFYNGGLVSAAGSMPKDQWHHLIWVRTGGGTASEGSTLYLDGVDVTASLVADANLCCNGLTPDVGATEFRINRARDLEDLRLFQATVDEIALYDRELSASEAQAHYRAFMVRVFADDFESGDSSAWH